MARLTAKDGVVEIVPSDSEIKVLKEKDGRDTFKTIEVDTPRDLKQGKPEPAPQTTTKGIRKALRGGGRAFGQNS